MLTLPETTAWGIAIGRKPTEDAVDRLNFLFSTILLTLAATLVGGKQHFGSPIQCMPPAESPGSWVNYYHDLCYIKDTYYMNATRLTSSIRGYGEKETPRISYYQWVPYVLMVQVLLFLVPQVFWHVYTNEFCSGKDLRMMVNEANSLRTKFGKKRTDSVEELCDFTIDALNNYRNWRYLKWLSTCGTSLGYAIMKWLCVANAVGQFFLLGEFVGRGNLWWGFKLLQWESSDNNLRNELTVFPLVTVCEIKREEVGQPKVVPMQCVITLNFINEKVYLVIYFWLIFVAIVTFFSALHRTLFLLFPALRVSNVQLFLPIESKLFETVEPKPARDRQQYWIRKFTNGTLGADGVLFLHFVACHCGMHIARDIAFSLWKKTIPPLLSSNEDIAYCDFSRKGPFSVTNNSRQPLLGADIVKESYIPEPSCKSPNAPPMDYTLPPLE